MILDFNEILEARREIPLFTTYKQRTDKMCDVILDSEKDELFVLLPLHFGRLMVYERIRKEIINKYYITDIHNVGTIFGGNTVKFVLYGFSRKKPQYIRVSEYLNTVVEKEPYIPEEIKDMIFQKKASEITDDDIEYLTLIDFPEYTTEFEAYINGVKEWIDKGQYVANLEGVISNAVKYENANLDIPTPDMNSIEALSFFEKLEQEAVIKLNQVAEIKRSEGRRYKDEERKKYIPVSFFEIRDAVDIGNRESREMFLEPFPVKKYDIITPEISSGPNQFYMMKEDLPKNVCLRHAIVIRPTEISPHYLYMYLQSEKANRFLAYMSYTLQITPKTLNEMPIMEPCIEMVQQAEETYRYVYCNADISLADEINKILQAGNKIPKAKPLQELIGIELQEKLKKYKVELVTDLIGNDMQELEKCFEVGAYKACIIICGSILETVMLDWLSEKENTDYFIKDDFIELNQIIKKVKLLQKHPEWKKYHEAQNVRVKRNLVHPAKIAKEHVNIDKEMCASVIKDLREVLQSRGITNKKY